MYIFWSFMRLFLCMCLFSCISPNEKFHIHNINGSWEKSESVKFHLDIQDSENPKNITFVIRNNKDYKYRNLSLQVSMLQIGGKYKVVEKLNYILATPNGIWNGMGFGEVKENQVSYKVGYKFPFNAEYEIEISHLMDTDILLGIEDIGIKIETLKP